MIVKTYIKVYFPICISHPTSLKNKLNNWKVDFETLMAISPHGQQHKYMYKFQVKVYKALC